MKFINPHERKRLVFSNRKRRNDGMLSPQRIECWMMIGFLFVVILAVMLLGWIASSTSVSRTNIHKSNNDLPSSSLRRIVTKTDGAAKRRSNPNHQKMKRQNRPSKPKTQPFHITEEEKGGQLIEFNIANLDTFNDAPPSSTGTFIIQTKPSWSPLGTQRFHNLTASSYFDNSPVFRVIPNFIAQFGINPDFDRYPPIPDDVPFPPNVTNRRGTISFAMSGKHSRSTQVFINTRKRGNAYLDKEGFLPFGIVVSGMEEVVDRLYGGYGESAPAGKGPKQHLIWKGGMTYIRENFSKLSYITSAKVLDVNELGQV